jgi:UDP-N-acetyl-D-glucosamine dehydrogenase
MALVEQRKARIGILGLGYVGIPLALRFHEVGYSVLGFDIDDQRIADLNAGESPIKHIPSKDIAAMAAGGFEATSDFSRIGEVEAIIICVPTPLSRHREPDLSYIVETMKAVTPHMRAGQMLSLESTTWPGTTEEVLRPFIDSRGFTIGEDFFSSTLRNAKIPATPTSAPTPFPRLSAARRPPAARSANASTASRWTRWFRSRRPRPPN